MDTSIYRPQLVFATHFETGGYGISNDFGEAIAWINHNTEKNSSFIAWPGLERELVLSPRSLIALPLVELEGFFLSNEESAAKQSRILGAEYVVISFGGRCEFKQDTLSLISKIKSKEKKRWTLSNESIIYKFSYRNFANESTTYMKPSGFDLVRNVEIKDRIQLIHFEEVYTSTLWLVRIYKLLEKSENLK